MNRNRNLVVDFQINHKHDHYIGKEKHVQPSFVIDAKDGDGRVVSRKATKKKRKY